MFAHGKSVEDVESDKTSKAMKKRSTLKLLVELFFVGVIEDSSIFNNIIKDLTSPEHFRDRDTTQTNLSLLASFARQGRIFIGLPLTGQEIHEEVPLLFISYTLYEISQPMLYAFIHFQFLRSSCVSVLLPIPFSNGYFCFKFLTSK